MKIDNSPFKARFDFSVSPKLTQKTDQKPSFEEKTADNLPTIIDRSTTVLNINSPIYDENTDNQSHPPFKPENDSDAENRRRIARNLIGLDIDVRAMTPREASDVGLQLYAEGLVTWDEYAELAFQPELHPSYNQTIGALLGQTATPDQPRDFVSEWGERLAYEQRYNAINSPQVKSTQRITAILARLDGQITSLSV